MQKKVVHQPDFSKQIQAALSQPPDYTCRFTEKVESLRDALAEALNAPVEHDDDMNDGSAQKLVVWLNKECEPVKPFSVQATWRLVDLVSSKGSYFALVALRLSQSAAGWEKLGLAKPSRYWSIVPNDELPEQAALLEQSIAAVMHSNGYRPLDESILSREAERHSTALDGRPATVFEILFSEVL